MKAGEMAFNDKTVGLLGGGQLGRMFMEAAARLNVRVKIREFWSVLV